MVKDHRDIRRVDLICLILFIWIMNEQEEGEIVEPEPGSVVVE